MMNYVCIVYEVLNYVSNVIYIVRGVVCCVTETY